MAKATIRTVSESPTEQVTKAANAIEYCNDSRGRRIGIVKPTALARYRLLKMLGADNAGNPHVLGYAMLAACVRSLDGNDVMAPNNEREIEVLIDRLGDEGFEAIGKCLADKYGLAPTEASDENLRNL
jgi:hypothetical protein